MGIPSMGWAGRGGGSKYGDSKYGVGGGGGMGILSMGRGGGGSKYGGGGGSIYEVDIMTQITPILYSSSSHAHVRPTFRAFSDCRNTFPKHAWGLAKRSCQGHLSIKPSRDPSSLLGVSQREKLRVGWAFKVAQRKLPCRIGRVPYSRPQPKGPLLKATVGLPCWDMLTLSSLKG